MTQLEGWSSSYIDKVNEGEWSIGDRGADG